MKKEDETITIISDDVRLEIATQIVDYFQEAMKRSDTALFSDVTATINAMKNDKTIMHLIEIAERAKDDVECVSLPTTKDFDNIIKSALLLLLLESRQESNIN